MEALLYCCCGLDIHKDIIEACILRGTGQTPEILRKSFSSVKQGLKDLVAWTESNDCYSIAMESTGVYWIPVFEAFERNAEYTENLWVVNAHNMRNLPGRKSDVKDAEWIATLLRHGLLEKSFIPNEFIRDLRTENDVNEKCHRLRHTNEEICAAVCGSLRPIEQCLLKQLLNKIDNSQRDIDSLNDDMRLLTAQINDKIAVLTSIPGISEDSAVEIIAEISTAPQEYFDSPEKLCSWAGLSPRNDESAGTIKSRKIMHGNPYIKAILCQTAWASVYSRKSTFHDWFWTHQKKLGRKKAIIAVARKMLSLCWLLLKDNTFYHYIPIKSS